MTRRVAKASILDRHAYGLLHRRAVRTTTHERIPSDDEPLPPKYLGKQQRLLETLPQRIAALPVSHAVDMLERVVLMPRREPIVRAETFFRARQHRPAVLSVCRHHVCRMPSASRHQPKCVSWLRPQRQKNVRGFARLAEPLYPFCRFRTDHHRLRLADYAPGHSIHVSRTEFKRRTFC